MLTFICVKMFKLMRVTWPCFTLMCWLLKTDAEEGVQRLWSWRFNCNKQGIWWMVIIYMRLLLVNLGVQLFQRHLIFVHCWLCAVITLSHSFSSIFHPLSVDSCETKLLTWLKSGIRTNLDNITLDIISKVTVYQIVNRKMLSKIVFRHLVLWTKCLLDNIWCSSIIHVRY